MSANGSPVNGAASDASRAGEFESACVSGELRGKK
jgi:hypothetical protein